MAELFGGIEAGGTKFVCVVGTGPQDLRAEIQFPTTNPAENIAQCIAFFQEQEARFGRLTAVGIASFGPIDPNPGSPTFGTITSTPKPGWANTKIVAHIQQAFPIPIGFDTDVNGAALAEGQWGGGSGFGYVHLSNDWHRHWWWRRRWWSVVAWSHSSGNGPYSFAP